MQKQIVPNSWFSFPFPYKNVYSPASSVPPLSNLTSCIPHKSNLYFDNSFVAFVSEPALYKRFTFRVPILISIFRYP
jgi:hypothetical protein